MDLSLRLQSEADWEGTAVVAAAACDGAADRSRRLEACDAEAAVARPANSRLVLAAWAVHSRAEWSFRTSFREERAGDRGTPSNCQALAPVLFPQFQTDEERMALNLTCQYHNDTSLHKVLKIIKKF